MAWTALAALAALATLGPAAAAAPDPCGGVSLEASRVVSARPLRAVEKATPEEAACLDAIGRLLGGRAAIRSVTVAVRLPDAQRAAGVGPAIGDRYKAALVKGGVPEARISVVVPTATEGEAGTVAIVFAEKQAERAVAVIEMMGGTVTAGPDRGKLAPVTRGATLDPETYVATGAGSTAWIGLADGSRLRLGENSLLLVGRLHLDDDLERVVRLQLVSGELEVVARTGGERSIFDIGTRFGTAGVRGTRFRLTAGEAGTRLETLEGRVALAAAGDRPQVLVGAGQGAAIDGSGAAGQPAALPASPAVIEPLEGAVKPGAKLAWQPVDGAGRYTVELARDAEFTFDVRRAETSLPALAIDGQLDGGKWFWRVSAVGADGFVGPPSKVHAFERAP